MSNSPGSHDFVYVHTDIPAGTTIREWRAQRAASRPARTRRVVLVAVRRRLDSATRMWHATARRRQRVVGPGTACGWGSVTPAGDSTARDGAVKPCPDGSLRES